MSNFIEELMGSIGGDVAKQLASTLNIDANAAQKMIPAVAPLILGGLKRQKDNFGGEQRIDHILNKYGSASVLNDLGGLFAGKAKESNADPRLGGLLGDSGVQAASMLSNQFNLSGQSANKLITMLAPVILGALTKKRDTEGVGSSGIGALLDQDGDGNILDDVAGFLLGSLTGGGGSKQSQSGGSLLGSLLGSLFGKK